MRCTADAALAAADPAVPGLGAVLDADHVAGTLASAFPHAGVQHAAATYVRYKPATSCLVAYSLRTDTGDFDAYGKAHRPDAAAKVDKLLERADAAGPWRSGALRIGEQAVLAVFPNDRRLPGARALAHRDGRARLLDRIGLDGPALGDPAVRRLRYKPERRYVARLDGRDGPAAAVKCYTGADFARADAGARAFRPTGPLRVARRLGASTRHGVLAFEWLAGRPLPAVLRDRADVATTMKTVGDALGRLHAAPGATLNRLDRADEALPVLTAAQSVAAVLPELAGEARGLALQCATGLLALPDERTCVHGDFSADQVLLADDHVTVLDYDAASLGDPASDLGLFRANLLAGAARGDGTVEEAEAATQALLDGYRGPARADPRARLDLYTAAWLTRLTCEPFRYRHADWPAETRAILELAGRVWRP